MDKPHRTEAIYMSKGRWGKVNRISNQAPQLDILHDGQQQPWQGTHPENKASRLDGRQY